MHSVLVVEFTFEHTALPALSSQHVFCRLEIRHINLSTGQPEDYRNTASQQMAPNHLAELQAVPAFKAVSQAHSQWVLGNTKTVHHHQ